MKKSAVILGGVLAAVVLAGGGIFLATGGDGKARQADVSAYWDGKSPLNTAAADGVLPLVKAVKDKNAAVVRYLLENGADASLADKDGQSVLALAAQSGSADIFGLIVTHLALTELKDPLYLDKAISGGNAEIVKQILDNGGDANAVLSFKGKHRPDENPGYQDARIMTPLKKAVTENKPEVAAVLLKHGAEGASFFLAEYLKDMDTEMIKTLATTTGSLRTMSVKGMDLLTYAASEAKPQTIKYLLEENAGDAIAALQRLVVYRDRQNDYEAAVEMFAEAGVTPADDTLEYLLNKGENKLFSRLAGCLTAPNVLAEDKNKTLLKLAAESGNAEAAKQLLTQGADMWAVEADGLSPLKEAVRRADKHPDVYDVFRARIKDIDEAGYAGETLLMLLAENGDFARFKETVEKGADIWQKDNEGRTALMFAAKGGNVEILEFLIRRGDNLAAVDKSGKTVLMYAAESGKLPSFAYLLERSDSKNAVDNDGRTALMYAAQNGYTEIARQLINAGESVAASDKNNKTVLMYAAESGNMEMFEELVDKKADYMLLDNQERSVLFYAVSGQNKNMVSRLVRSGMNIYEKDKYGYMPFILAAAAGAEDIFDMIFNFLLVGNVYTRDNGRTLGMYAVDGGNAEIIRQVLKVFPESLNKKDNNGQTFLMLLAEKGRPDALRDALRGRGNPRARDNQGKSVLMYAAESQSGVNLMTVLHSGLTVEEVNIRDHQGRSALMYALGSKYNLGIKQQLLLKYEAEADAVDKSGKSVLMYAVGNRLSRVDAKSVKELLENNIQIDRADGDGRTALMYAAANPKADSLVITALLQAGASVKAVDKSGKTVLMYAAESGDISKFRELLAAGAEKGGQTVDGRTVEDFAKQVGSCFAAAVVSATRA